MDAGTYDVSIDDGVAQSFAFDEPVPSIDTIRLFADGLNQNNFASRSVDDVLLYVPAGGSCAGPPVGTDNLRIARSGDDLTLSWDDPGGGAVTWNVYRDADPDPATWGAPHAQGVTDGDLGTAGIQYVDTGAVSAGPVLHYLVMTVNACGESPLR
jgi:hypothetical protein